MNYEKLSLVEQVNLVQTKQVSASELVAHYLRRLNDVNQKLNAFVLVNESVLAEAKFLDQKIAKNENVGPLAGLPIGIKDMLCTKGLRTTAGSKMLENFIPPYDATVVSRLKEAGALVLGKQNQDEFAMGSSNETSFWGPTKNPWALDRVPGGSSGGSASAQAAGICAASIGTDTGGSIRQPASFCGVVGVKPTYGRVSRYGIISYASSLDQAGPLANSVEDAALVLQAIAGFCPHDATSSEKAVPHWTKDINKNLRGRRVGVIKEFLNDGLDSEVARVMADALAALRLLGAEIVEVSLPLLEHAVPTYYLIASSEASSNLARYDGVKFGYRSEFPSLSALDLETFYGKTRAEGFGVEVKRRIMMGTYFLSSGYYDAYYAKASQVRRLITEQYLASFEKYDVLLSPVATAPAFKIGERISDPLQMYLNDIFTTSTNLAGLPGMSLPFGMSEPQGLPIGIQLTAKHFDEQTLFDVGSALEEVSKVKGVRPDVG